MTAWSYASGSPNWNATAEKYGVDAANRQWQWAIDQERAGTLDAANAPDPSFWSILGNQLATNPLQAPLESANTVIGNSFWSFLKSPWVVFAVVVIVFAAMGGFAWLGKKVFKTA